MLTMSTLSKPVSVKESYHQVNLAETLKKNALKLIKKAGIAQFNLRELAKACDVSATAVYRHYKNKEHLLSILAEDGFSRLRIMLSDAALSETNSLQCTGMAYITFAVKNEIYFRLMFGSYIDIRKFSALLKANQACYQILHALILRGVEQGLMTGSADSMARTAWATVHGAALLLLDKQFICNEKIETNAEKIGLEVTEVLGRGLFK